jgi:hypothetical protein
VRDALRIKNPLTYSDISNNLYKYFPITMNLSVLYHFVSENLNLKTVRGKPFEEDRVKCDLNAIEEYFDSLQRTAEETPAAFVFNADETGFHDWADKHEICAIVPIEYQKEIIEIPVKRQGKRASLLGCISADGSALKPMVIVTRRSFEDELWHNGYTPEKVKIVY